jgi:hypothetical protein
MVVRTWCAPRGGLAEAPACNNACSGDWGGAGDTRAQGLKKDHRTAFAAR